MGVLYSSSGERQSSIKTVTVAIQTPDHDGIVYIYAPVALNAYLPAHAGQSTFIIFICHSPLATPAVFRGLRRAFAISPLAAIVSNGALFPLATALVIADLGVHARSFQTKSNRADQFVSGLE